MNTKTYEISKHDSYKAVVLRETASGCILQLDLENNNTAYAYAFANFSKGDVLRVTILKIYDDPFRHPLAGVDSVLSYFSESVA